MKQSFRVVPDELLQELRRLDTPAVANAIDSLGVRPPVGFNTAPTIRCHFPDLGVVAGYAATVTVSARASQEPSPSAVHRHRYWEYLASLPAPRIVVIKDLDAPDAVSGAFIGEVNGTIHRGLGVIAAVTDGAFRDVEECRGLGLQIYAPAVITSAGFIHMEAFGTPVEVGGLMVQSGDLLHADRHGVLSVPIDAAERIPAAAAALRAKEREVVDLYRSGGFTLDALKAIRPR